MSCSRAMSRLGPRPVSWDSAIDCVPYSSRLEPPLAFGSRGSAADRSTGQDLESRFSRFDRSEGVRQSLTKD